MLKKDAFHWNSDASLAFENHKKAMTTTPFLTLPDFSKTFVLETDACSNGIGAVLMQDGRPLAFISKPLSPRNIGRLTYEKEMLAILEAIKKWKTYLQGHHFIIKTDHQSLRYLLEQRVHLLLQQKWLIKLLGLNYEITYKKGTENKAADALSRINEENYQLNQISLVTPCWQQEVIHSYDEDEGVQEKIRQLIHPQAIQDYQLGNGLLKFQGKIYIGSTTNLKKKILQELHNEGCGGHSGIHATYKRISLYFYWPNLRDSVKNWVGDCDIC